MSTKNLHDEILAAVERGGTPTDLITIVRRHKARGVGQQATYDTLDAIRAELCRNLGPENPRLETVEAVMDRVWGYCPEVDQIWESPLSHAREV